MTLTLISVEDGYSVYEDEAGDEVLIALLLPYRRVVLWSDFDLPAAWQAAVSDAAKAARWPYRPDRHAFIDQVRLAVADQDSIDIVWCDGCEGPVREDEAESVNRDAAYACQSCYEDDYRSCDDCGETVHNDYTYYTLHDESVCNRCINSSYSHCEECDGYYHDSYVDDHDHEGGGCDCESPQQVFSMRNDGEPVLNQDERVTIALPSGVISPEGIGQISALIQRHGYTIPVPPWSEGEAAYTAAYNERDNWWKLASELETALGAQWQTKEGNYTKRLSKLAHKSQGIKIPPALLSQVGCIARDNSTGVDFAVEITRDLNLPAEEFYHEDSCWWQSYSESRCSLKSNGGIGMRTFGGPYGSVQGRAWIMPLRLNEDGALRPTFDSLTPDAFMIFNGYGDLSGYTPARIVAHMAGMTYRKVRFDCSPMYVNNGTGYLVASEEIAARYTDRGVSLYTDTHSNLHHDETRELATV